MNRGYTYGNPYRYGYSLQKTTSIPQKWPQDIQCVVESSNPSKGSIYVSNIQAASNLLTLTKFNIKAVMTCARGHHVNIPKSKLEMFEYFPFDDKQNCDISPYFERACDFIAKALQKTNVLVHCIAGVSRSVSMVLAYLIRDKGMTYEQAYYAVKAKRKIISPNEGFIKQLKDYAMKIRERAKTAKKQYKNASYTNTYTPEKPSTSTNYPTQRYYNTMGNKKSPLLQDQGNRRNIPNEEDTDLEKNNNKIHRTITPDKIEHTFSMTPTKYRRQENNFTAYKNNSTMIAKSSTFIEGQKTLTPQKKKNQYATINSFGVDTDENSRLNYFKQMNKQLNQKIEAIHAKYQKQRQELINRRGYSSGSMRQTSKYPPTTATDYPKHINQSHDLKQRLDKYRQFSTFSKQSDKYNNFYQSKYSRGLRYTAYSKNTGYSYYKSKYY